MGSLSAECRENGIRVGVHTLSPGMVLTELILDGATNQNKQVGTFLHLYQHWGPLPPMFDYLREGDMVVLCCQ